MLYDPERGDERRDSIEFRIGLRKRACRRAGNAGKVGDPVIYLVDDQVHLGRRDQANRCSGQKVLGPWPNRGCSDELE